METSPRRRSQRRQWKRYKLKGGAIVLLHKPRFMEIGKPKLVELGPVIDISRGGLAVQYVESEKRMFESTGASGSGGSDTCAILEDGSLQCWREDQKPKAMEGPKKVKVVDRWLRDVQ